MEKKLLYEIKKDPNLYRYLKYHSNWYKILSRDPRELKTMIKEMKQEYKLTITDKIDDLSKKISLLNTFLDVLE